MKTLNKIITMAGFVVTAILPMAVGAAMYYVAPAPTGDDGNAGTQAAPFATIQKALDSITPANCWKSQIIIAAGTYKIESELTPTYGTYTYTIKSASGDPSDVTIDAQGLSRCFNCAGSSGRASTGITFKGITFINGSVTGNGGGVRATSGCSFEDCVFRNCKATGSGGGIAANAALDHITNVLVDGCSATSDGGGMYIPAGLTGSDGMSNCRIYNCSGGSRGGGVYMESTALSTVSNCDISCNTASGAAGGGGMFAKNAAISSCTVTNNVCDHSNTSSEGTGGSGIRLMTYGTIDGCLVKGNSFTYDCSSYNGGGAAVYLANGSSLVNSAIIGNSGARSVGMQWSNCGGILVSNCLFKSNVARLSTANPLGWGGILYIYGLTADSLITDCRFIDNQAESGGGVVGMQLDSGTAGSTLRIRNCLILGNAVKSKGAGIVRGSSSTSAAGTQIALENCTIVSNTIPNAPVINPYVESEQWTSRNFISVSGCAILFNNKAAFDDTFKASANVTYNCTELNGMSAGNIKYDSTKPLFEDMANGNFRPAKRSQLRDLVPAAPWMGDGSKRSTSRDLGTGYEIRPAGTYGVDVVWTDSVPRLYGSAADIGCSEYWQESTGFSIIFK